MQITISLADNGFIVEVEDPQNVHSYFVALDIIDVVGIIGDLLADATSTTFDLSDLAFNQVPNDKA
jgi:hypothetical protein